MPCLLVRTLGRGKVSFAVLFCELCHFLLARQLWWRMTITLEDWPIPLVKVVPPSSCQKLVKWRHKSGRLTFCSCCVQCRDVLALCCVGSSTAAHTGGGNSLPRFIQADPVPSQLCDLLSLSTAGNAHHHHHHHHHHYQCLLWSDILPTAGRARDKA